MRVLVCSDRWGDLPAARVTGAIADGWGQRQPTVERGQLPLSAGGRGFVSAVGHALGVAPSEPAVVRRGRVVYLEAARLCPGGDSTLLGHRMVQAVRDGADRLVIGLGDVDGVDGGEGMIRAIGGGEPAQALPAARELLAQVAVTGACDVEVPLLGMQGASASTVETLGWSRRRAQDSEAAIGAYADQVRRLLPARRDLLTGAEHRPDRTPGAGAGGGVGFGILALGGRLVPGPEVLAELTGLDRAVAGASLVVVGTEVFDWRSLEHAVVATVVESAVRAAVPAIVLAESVEVGRRETMSLGAAAAYPVHDPTTRRPAPTAAELPDAVTALARRVAGTWTAT